MKTFSAVVLFLLVGCASQRIVHTPLKEIQPLDFWKDQALRRSFLTEFSGKLKLGYQGKDQRVSGRGRILGRNPRSYRLELRDSLGRLHYALTVSDGTLVAHFPRNHQALRDSTAGRTYFRRLLGLELSFADLSAFFFGVIPAHWDAVKFTSWEWDADKGGYRGILQKAEERLTVWVDSGNTGLLEAIWENEKDRIEASYKEFDPCCAGSSRKFALASDVGLEIASQKTSVSVSWEGLGKPTHEIPSSAFEAQLAPGDKKIDLK